MILLAHYLCFITIINKHQKYIHILNAEHLGTFYRIMYLGDV